MSPTLKDLETTLSRILSHAKLCRCLIHLPLFPLPTNNIMAVVSDVQKQKIGMGMTLATQQHLLASSARTAIPECMNAQSLIISQKKRKSPEESDASALWCIQAASCQCAARTLKALKGSMGIHLPTAVTWLKWYFLWLSTAVEIGWKLSKAISYNITQSHDGIHCGSDQKMEGINGSVCEGINKQLLVSGFKGQSIISQYSVSKIMHILDCVLPSL